MKSTICYSLFMILFLHSVAFAVEEGDSCTGPASVPIGSSYCSGGGIAQDYQEYVCHDGYLVATEISTLTIPCPTGKHCESGHCVDDQYATDSNP